MPEIADLLKEGKITDPFFEVLNDGDWNACIGTQGEALNYVEGYLQAAQLLADTLIEKELYGQRDTLVMPILYNARHGLELALKHILDDLVALRFARPREGARDHNIAAYWDYLVAEKVGDRATRSLLAELKPYVDSLARIDEDGQELRYFINREGEQSLGDQAVANLLLIRASVEGLRHIVDQMTDRMARLDREGVTGTRTNRCSRTDLAEIARTVGPKSRWSEPAFDDRKAELRERFDLSSNDFSRALTTIQTSRELKVLLELETPLLHLSAEQVVEVASRWRQAHPPRTGGPRMIDVTDIDIDDFLGDADGTQARRAALDHWVTDTLSLEQFADLQTIFYVGRNREFGEEYERRVAGTVREHSHGDHRIARVHHILSKTNFLEGLIDGLERVGQPGLAARVAAIAAGQ